MRRGVRSLLGTAIVVLFLVLVVPRAQFEPSSDHGTTLTALLLMAALMLVGARLVTTSRRAAGVGLGTVALVGLLATLGQGYGHVEVAEGVAMHCAMASATWHDPELFLAVPMHGSVGDLHFGGGHWHREAFFPESSPESFDGGQTGGILFTEQAPSTREVRVVHFTGARLSIDALGEAVLSLTEPGPLGFEPREAHLQVAPLYETLGLLQPSVEEFKVLGGGRCWSSP